MEGTYDETGLEKIGGAVGSLRRGGMSGRLGWLESLGLAEGDITEICWNFGCVDK